MELIDAQFEKLKQQIKNVQSIDELMGKEGLLSQLAGDIINGLLEAERDAHLGYPPHAVEGHRSGNSRNGYSKKTVQSDRGPLALKIPRDREGSFTPLVVPPHSRVLTGVEDQVFALYAVGMSTRDISEQLAQLYGPSISPSMVSQITDRILPLLQEWQNRLLDPIYVVLYLDAIHLKVRRDGRVQNTAIYTCLGVNLRGEKQLLGLWIGDAEGARFWQGVLTDLKNRGVEDVVIACVDGLAGFPEAIASVFPRTEVQQCVIHAIRRSLQYVGWNNRKAFMADLKPVYKAMTEQEGLQALDRLESAWGKRYPQAIATWRNHWQYLSTFFAYPECIRRVIYTTNAVEAVHRQMRKVTKTKGAFPSEEAALKQLFLNLRLVERKWATSLPHWQDVLNYLMVSHHERIVPFLK
jgi:transposase-like protein